MDQLTLDQWSVKRPIVEPKVLSVSQVAQTITRLLEGEELKGLRVTGEITNYKRHSSGHLYFSLSETCGEKEYTIRCSIWKNQARYLPFTPSDGMFVEAFGSVNHYERNGQYTLIISQMWQSGAGEKALLIEQWKRELAAKGYFSPDRKRALPPYPVRIGVVTSSTGAVIHDIRNVLSCRFPVEIVLSPTTVQGPGAHEEIAAAIRTVAGEVDVLIVGRGGGSYEDLFVFNHPVVVEAIATCPVPVVSAIGHEVDITLADLAADRSASTPSHAAELCVPDRKTEIETLNHLRTRIYRRTLSCTEQAQEDLNDIRERLSVERIERVLSERRQYLVDLSDRMTGRSSLTVDRGRVLLQGLSARIEAKNPAGMLRRDIPERWGNLRDLEGRLKRSALARFDHNRMALSSLAALIEAHSPYAACRGGYCMVLKDGLVVSTTTLLTSGDEVQLRFGDGEARATIQEVRQDEKV
ncbi:MAG TPA: exodeoxyribonuclease VII large subunit [Methanospirillum sp.]|nr:exodeoxyribonuclease VII large subunit [Methanospirillum sp.]